MFSILIKMVIKAFKKKNKNKIIMIILVNIRMEIKINNKMVIKCKEV